MIYGNVDSIRNTTLEKLEDIYNLTIPKETVVTEELVEIMCQVTEKIGREISVAIDRKGKVVYVSIGDSTTVEVPVIDIKEKKLSNIRIIHTHPNGSSMLSALDMSALLKFKLDCIAALGVEDGRCGEISLGFCSVENDVLIGETLGPITLEEATYYDILDKIRYIESIIKQNEVVEDDNERAILVGIESEESLDELEELSKACDVVVLNKVLQNRNKVDSAYYIGKGKVEELTLLRQALRANLIIFDDELDGSQVRNLEEAVGVKVIDRTTLILEIFARRARTREAKIQVELAQLKYRVTRLIGLGTVLSRTGGGIGTKGPGEKKLEIDRRHIKERIYDLLSELERVKRVRETQREKRNNVPNISLVGYTNAGKSTLRNRICEIAMPKDGTIKEKVFEANMLFATLDTTTRAILLPDNRTATLTDTVGFVRKLPHELVEAFKSTLEEVIYSDLLVHVVDVSAPSFISQIEAVESVLKELGARDKTTILALNKIDIAAVENINEVKERFSSENIKIVEISAKNSTNLDTLLNEFASSLPSTLKKVSYIIPYSEQSVVAFLHRNALIEAEEYVEAGTMITAKVDDEVYNKTSNFTIE